jgi:hypothetical protein
VRRLRPLSAVQCCHRDRSLPTLGDWPGPIHGEPGVLAFDADGKLAQCHACGANFRSMSVHAVQAHDLSAREYKAIFGFRFRTAVWSPESQARLHARLLDHLRPYRATAGEQMQSMTPEQLAIERHWALEARRDPANLARRQALGRQFAPRAQKRVQDLLRVIAPEQLPPAAEARTSG